MRSAHFVCPVKMGVCDPKPASNSAFDRRSTQTTYQAPCHNLNAEVLRPERANIEESGMNQVSARLACLIVWFSELSPLDKQIHCVPPAERMAARDARPTTGAIVLHAQWHACPLMCHLTG
jgi:hypothetical protein